MNKIKRNRLNLLRYQYENIDVSNINAVRCLKDNFEDLLEEEQEAYDNMPENFQNSSRGMESEDAIDEMQDYIDELEEMLNS